MALKIMSLQALPGSRDHRINMTLRGFDPHIQVTVVVETPDYNRVFESLGHRSEPVHIWRARPRVTLIDKIYYYFLSEKSAGRRLAEIVDALDVDIIHTYNYDHLAYYALKYTNRPVVHDVSDLYSIFPRHYQAPKNRVFSPWKFYNHLRRLRYEEFALENSHGLVFNSAHLLDAAQQRYKIKGRALVVPHGVSQVDLPEQQLPKLSGQDQKVHTVFEGHINKPEFEQLEELANRGVHVHLYALPTKSVESVLHPVNIKHPYMHYHEPLPYRALLQELTQYDYGLVLWYKGAKEEFFQVNIPCKFFDYLASGLPVIVGPFRSMVDFVQTKGCGFVLRDINELEEGLAQQYSLGDPKQYTMEHYIPALVDLYRELV